MKGSSRSLIAATVFLAGVSVAAPPLAPAPAAPQKPQEAVIETPKGVLVVRLLPEIAPRHVAHFVKTAKAGGYDGTTFHRIIMGGIIQGGDPLSKDPKQGARYGTGGLGLLRAEFSERPFARGVVAAVLRPGDPNSGGTQFFVVLREQPSLKGKYTIFGELSSGIEVADQLSLTPVDGDKAKERVEMKVTIRDVADAPQSPAP